MVEASSLVHVARLVKHPLELLGFRRGHHPGRSLDVAFRTGDRFRVRWGSGDLGTVLDVLGRRIYDKPGFAPKLGDVVVDVGANVGAYTVPTARAVGPSGKVLAFEPEPANLRALQENVKLNGLENVRIDDRALAGGPGPRFLSQEPGTVAFALGETGISVQAVALDRAMQEHGLDHIDILKMNCEGAEHEILRSASTPLARIDRIVGEYHGDRAGFQTVLERSGFEVQVRPLPKFRDLGLFWARRTHAAEKAK